MTVFTEEVEKFLEADPPSRCAATARHVLSVCTFNVSLSTFHVSSDGKWNYIWNGENRLVAMSNAATVLNFAYDSQGRRFLKIVDDGSSVTTNTFLYDDWNMTRSVTLSNDGVISSNHYVWGLDLSGSFQGAGGIGGLLSVTVAGVGDPGSFSPSFDANGNITEYVSTNGTAVAHYQYGPFGETIAAVGEMKDNFKYRFSSKYEDTETGLLYYGYRYYNPELGRWPNRDPIEERGGLNVYGFVGNSALNSVDLLGMLNVLAAKRNTPADPQWNHYSDVIFKLLASLANQIAAFGGKDIFGEPCSLSVGRLNSPSLSVFQHNGSLGAPEGPDYGILWTKSDSGTPFGMTKEGVLEGKSPRCDLSWYGSYVKEWLESVDLDYGSWIVPDSGAMPVAVSGASVVKRVMEIFNAYRCCRETESGSEFMQLEMVGYALPEPIPGYLPNVFKLNVTKVPCEECTTEDPFKCLL